MTQINPEFANLSPLSTRVDARPGTLDPKEIRDRAYTRALLRTRASS